MKPAHYPQLDETLSTSRLENGLSVAVVPRKGFTKSLAYFVTDFGSIHTDFSFDEKEHHVPAGIAHYLEHKLFDMPEGRDVSAEFAAMGAMDSGIYACRFLFHCCSRIYADYFSRAVCGPD